MTLPKLDISHPIVRYTHPVALVERIRALVLDGDTAAKIVELCQPMTLKLLTRNAVIGMIHRHKMTGPRINQHLVRKPKTERPSRAKPLDGEVLPPVKTTAEIVQEALTRIPVPQMPAPGARAPAPETPAPDRASISKEVMHLEGGNTGPEPVATSPCVASLPRGGILLLDLKPRHCRWPLWGAYDSSRLYCGRTKTDNSYCAKHHRMGRSGG